MNGPVRLSRDGETVEEDVTALPALIEAARREARLREALEDEINEWEELARAARRAALVGDEKAADEGYAVGLERAVFGARAALAEPAP